MVNIYTTINARAGAVVIGATLIAQLFFASPLGASIREPDLDARLGQRDFLREPLARIHVRIVGALELFLQRVYLVLREGGAIALQLALESESCLSLFVVLHALAVHAAALVIFVLAIQVGAVQVFCYFEKIIR